MSKSDSVYGFIGKLAVSIAASAATYKLTEIALRRVSKVVADIDKDYLENIRNIGRSSNEASVINKENLEKLRNVG